MKAANSAVFQRLAQFAGDREFPIPNPQAARWVHANPNADKVLKAAQLCRSMSFGRFRHLAWLIFDERHYVATVGFDHEVMDPSLTLMEDVQGFDVCLLAELKVSPSVAAARVFDVVAAGSLDENSAYQGHDNDQVMPLFPQLRVYESADQLSDDIVWSAFLGICSDESRHGGSWIESDLADSLSILAESNIESLPYQELCRSTLDLDPRSLYMSLYRCIEATYAHDKASRLKASLSVEHSWNMIAAVLENEMSWRPLEAESLNAVLRHAQNQDLIDVCQCLDVKLGEDLGNLSSLAGKAIYKLRNQIVHYRPAHIPLDFESTDWNRLCKALVAIASDVFHQAYGQQDAQLGTG